ncbi:signal peptidase I [Enterococcus sp. 5H]|uniref:signal peptidase I n=1 Tax=Enterococcus sp. 5H TaxID=1229490 RepID=UPI002304A319|nr:signal peptidase I [Enterococcus sp. 5H]MDA9470610.1 Signal peptidase I [Enterococcus sp. 5H]
MTHKKKAVKKPEKQRSSSLGKRKKQRSVKERQQPELKAKKKISQTKSSRKITGKSKRTKSSTKKRYQQQKRRNKKLKVLLIQLGLTFVISLTLFSTISYFTIRTPKMEGYAMTATLTNNDRVLVNKLGTTKRFKMVYFKHPVTKETSLRRIIGLPGDELYYKNDQLYINNKLTPERFLESAIVEAKQSGFLLTQDFTLKQITDETRIPEGQYFVLGDNRQFSTDSRDYGLIDEKNIIGVVELRFFPLHTATRF